MLTKQNIVEMEKKYVSLFSEKTFLPSCIVFRDDQQTDKYFHNFLMIHQDGYDINDLMTYEDRKKQDGFVIYRSEDVNLQDVSFLHDYQVETYGYYAGNIDDLTVIPKTTCDIEMVHPNQDPLFFDFMYQEDLQYGKSYAVNNVKRQKEVLINHADHYFYIKAMLNQKVIGHFNAFIDGNIAKVDEFYVQETYQKQGFGTSLMAYMLNELKSRGIEAIYLVTNLEDTAKDLYVKYGFKQVGQFKQYQKIFITNKTID